MISVIVPIYNVKAYLPDCIESLTGQSFPDMEIILVDDGSTDGSGQVCEEYRRKDGRIKVLHKKNAGLVSARKSGLDMATGQYIAFVDGDDWVERDMYGRMYRKMKAENVDVVLCSRYEDTGDASREVFHGFPEGRYGKTELMQSVYPRMIAGSAFFEWGIFPGLWDKLFRRECVEAYQMAVDDRITMGEDAACTYPCLLHADSIYIMHECLYHYRQTVSSMVKNVQGYGAEKKQFQILYQSVKRRFEKDAHIYNLAPQWRNYILFLMVPRADGLYRGFENLGYLFPFPKVKRGSRIILYGAGTYGQRLSRYLGRTGFCHVVSWVDRNYCQFRDMGLAVDNPAVIAGLQYDAIVVANTYKESRTALYRELAMKYPEKKIHLIDERLIFSKKTMEAFGLGR